MFMQVIHAETEQTDENVVVNLIVDRMLNHIRELELNTTDVVGNEKVNEIMNARTELDTNSAEAAAYINNCEIVHENINLEKTLRDLQLQTFLPSQLSQTLLQQVWRNVLNASPVEAK